MPKTHPGINSCNVNVNRAGLIIMLNNARMQAGRILQLVVWVSEGNSLWNERNFFSLSLSVYDFSEFRADGSIKS